MNFIQEVVNYVRRGRKEFHHEARIKERIAEQSYQSSMTSAMDVARNARQVRSNADFIKEVMKGVENK